MNQQIKEDWIINNRNILGLSQEISLTISTIQYEMLDQLEGKKINSISDFFGTKIDVTKNIRLAKSLTIQTAFDVFLGFDTFKPIQGIVYNCSMIVAYLQLSLLKEYKSRKHKNILSFSEYENQYNILLNGYLSSNIDTDEQDFIKAELTLCDNLISELMKPIYNEISPFKDVLDLPSSFKKNLINSLDKRKKFLKQKENEKTPKIKGLFQFVEYLHSNIERFNQYNDLIKELDLLKAEKNRLNPENNYKDKLQYDKVQSELESKFKILQDNTANLIKAKAKELNVCDFDNEPIYRFNGIEVEIFQLKRDFNDEDFFLIPLIFKHKSQYLEYRIQTHKTFLSLQLFFEELDDIAKSLFDYFKDTEQNEFEPFETKAIQVNSIEEAIKGFKQGHTKFVLPNTFLNPSNIHQQNNIEPLPPQSREPEPSTTSIKYISKPCFKSESIENTISVLNNYFDTTQHADLKEIIETGSNATEKLLFKDNGNKLTDYFRELFNNNTITGCTKTVLINWIVDNFKFTNGSSKKDYRFDTVEKVISSKDRLCKNPII
jgi:hypothetical protein